MTAIPPHCAVAADENGAPITQGRWEAVLCELELAKSALSEERSKVEAAERDMLRIWGRLEKRTFHHPACNANQSEPIGGSMCICVPPELRAQRSYAELVSARACKLLEKMREHEDGDAWLFMQEMSGLERALTGPERSQAQNPSPAASAEKHLSEEATPGRSESAANSGAADAGTVHAIWQDDGVSAIPSEPREDAR